MPGVQSVGLCMCAADALLYAMFADWWPVVHEIKWNRSFPTSTQERSTLVKHCSPPCRNFHLIWCCGWWQQAHPSRFSTLHFSHLLTMLSSPLSLSLSLPLPPPSSSHAQAERSGGQGSGWEGRGSRRAIPATTDRGCRRDEGERYIVLCAEAETGELPVHDVDSVMHRWWAQLIVLHPLTSASSTVPY